MESGLPQSIIEISYLDPGIDSGELVEAFMKEFILPFESDILKALVLVRGFSGNPETKEKTFTLKERAANFSIRYKKVDLKQPAKDETMVFILPENVKNLVPLEKMEELRKLPYIRLVRKKHIPKEWME